MTVAMALPASAQGTVKLFGKTYNVVKESRGQTYKNGQKVVMPDDGTNRKANLFFVQGADASQDRLFVSCPVNAEPAHQLYVLTGADTNGVFSAAAADMRAFFGGSVELAKGGRPVSVCLLNEVDTGLKADRNLALFCFDDGDGLFFYDLDTLSTGYNEDAFIKITQPEEAPDPVDENMPNGDMGCLAPGPNGTLLMAGRAAADDNGDRNHIEIGVIDPKQDKFFPVKTDLMQVTADSTIHIDPQDPNTEPNALIRVSDNEYWMIVSGDQQGSDDAAGSQFLFRMELTFPADLAKGKPGDIKAKILAKEDLLAQTAVHASDGGVFGLAIGREVAGGRRLYMADWQGNLYTLTPQ